MKCSKCSTDIPDDALFCVNCGEKTASNPASEAQSACPRCKTPLKPGVRFCGGCGSKADGETAPDVFCSNCAAKIKPHAAFCPKCGARQLTGPVAAQISPPAYRPPVQAYANQYSQAPVKRKNKKGLLVAVVVILVLALVGYGVFALFGRELQKSLMGPKAAYLMIERESLNGHVEDLIGTMVRYGNKSGREKGGFELELSVVPVEGAFTGDISLDPQMIEALKNIRFKNKLLYDRTTDSPRIYNLLDLLNQDGRVMTIEMLLADEEMLIHLPDVFDKYLVAAAGDFSDMFSDIQLELPGPLQGLDVAMLAGMLTGTGGLDLGIDEQALNSTLAKVVDIVLNNIDSCELSRGVTLQAGDVSASYDMYTMSITTQSVRNMLIEILERLKNDREFYNLFSQVSALADTYEGGYGEQMSFEEFQTELADAIDELRNNVNNEANVTITQKLYVDRDDQVVGRDLVIIDDIGETVLHFRYAQPRDGNREGYLLAIDTETESYEFLANYTIRNDLKTGSGTLSSMGSQILNIDFTDFIRQDIGTIEWPLGSFKVTVYETNVMDMELPPEINFSLRARDEQVEIEFDIPDTITLDVLYGEIPASEAAIPALPAKDRVHIEDDEAMTALQTPEAEEKMNEILRKLGINPDDF